MPEQYEITEEEISHLMEWQRGTGSYVTTTLAGFGVPPYLVLDLDEPNDKAVARELVSYRKKANASVKGNDDA